MINVETEIAVDEKCYHCGQPCEEEHNSEDGRKFCCFGCKTVYEILSANQLCTYYDLQESPGQQQKNRDTENFSFLDTPEVRQKVVTFDSDEFTRVVFYIPAIHCVSCIWLLENLHKIEFGVIRSEVVFGEKKVTIDFNPARTQLSTLAQSLAALGYPPKVNTEPVDKPRKRTDRSLIIKMAVAGFCSGNIMMFSFPEYLGIDHADETLIRVFGWLNLVLALPVFFYSGWDYMSAALRAVRHRSINLDVPIAAGLIALFGRSAWDVITATGAGYFDSFAGLVFFLLIGRWFQGKTYASLSFDRDFTAYFPLAVNRLETQNGESVWTPVVIYKLRPRDVIQVRNMEIIPTDSLLLDDKAFIDYSFVTGESRPVKANAGDRVYAGGRLIGTPVRLHVEKATSQSQLTSLWNNEAFKKAGESRYQKIIDRVARRFTWAVLFIATTTAVYWHFNDPSQTWLVVTAVLMVACPCALALSAPFTYGSMLREFGKRQLYLKNADVIERMAAVDTVVLDKTGTITHGSDPDVIFSGSLNTKERSAIKLLTSYSTHPLSKLLTRKLQGRSSTNVHEFKEVPGKGVEGNVDGSYYRVGSSSFTGVVPPDDTTASHVYVSIDGQPRGYFSIKTSVRDDIGRMLNALGTKCKALLSGDQDGDRQKMQRIFPPHAELRFGQTPQDKLDYIRHLQERGHTVLMLGDGLNDAGALKQSDVGIAVTDDSGVFTPASDGILYGERLKYLHIFLELARNAKTILKSAFVISFCYNAIALSFAVSGHLTPLVAAILMPLSSMTVVSYTTLAANVISRKRFNLHRTKNEST